MVSLTFSDSIFIERPAKVIYDMVADITRMGEWSPICKEGWWESGAGPEVGAWFVGKNVLPERTWETRSLVVVADPGKEFAFTVGGSITRWSYRFEDVVGGCEVTETWNLLDGGVEYFHEKFAGEADAQIAERERLAREGIPVTLAAIKLVAENA